MAIIILYHFNFFLLSLSQSLSLSAKHPQLFFIYLIFAFHEACSRTLLVVLIVLNM